MNIFQLFFKSTYSPPAIAKTRFQGVGKAIFFVFLLSILAALPNLYHISSGVVQTMNSFQSAVKEFPAFSIKDGLLHTDAKKPIESQSFGFVIVLDPTGAYGSKQIQEKRNSVGILKDKFVIAIDGQAQEMPYKMLPEEMTKQDIMTLVEQNKTVIVPVLCVLLFLSTAAGKFINVSVLAVIGLFIRNSLRKKLSYKQLWVMSAYSITLATVFFIIMDSLQAVVPSQQLLYWFVNFVMLFLAVKETPAKQN
ncbi:hypothetical protein ACH95_21900 [Bacillus glycinifermentans]|uniref:DUF1189 domain-containing protein n=1 Tax=Bacillus glycinifermentans TaxID=1664069 RepID=UPI000652FCD9|nr:DUF1189 domain-containing protein [Bacillus glycinifermentans]KMM53075.1 hypothetical protein ACH95_21900 [Bacillus glycinifermentans]MEC0496055.1 DUF1189 domain-containing protein [Bacillus glycinifermentans]MEC0539174.1 DUF1189 domain-containing protein [Bacillus glycinifermentans]